jgi:asparagine synthase (glutamine-hydrolysing)
VCRSPARRYLGFVSTLDSTERKHLYTPETLAKVDTDASDQIVIEPFERCDAPDDVTRALYVDIKTYLPEDILALSDRLSMWHSLEVRVPLVDHHLIELSGRLPVSYKLGLRRRKGLLKSIAQQHLPSEILRRRKQGFESPMAAWLRSDLADYARDVLSEAELARSGLFNIGYVSGKLHEHLAGRQKNNKLLFSLIMFQEWHKRYMA